MIGASAVDMATASSYRAANNPGTVQSTIWRELSIEKRGVRKANRESSDCWPSLGNDNLRHQTLMQEK